MALYIRGLGRPKGIVTIRSILGVLSEADGRLWKPEDGISKFPTPTNIWSEWNNGVLAGCNPGAFAGR